MYDVTALPPSDVDELHDKTARPFPRSADTFMGAAGAVAPPPDDGVVGTVSSPPDDGVVEFERSDAGIVVTTGIEDTGRATIGNAVATGLTAALGREVPRDPFVVVAVTVNVYDIPFFKPVTTHVLAATPLIGTL